MWQDIRLVVKNWPDDAPRWELYLCWQVDVNEPDAIKALKELGRQDFKRRHGCAPEFVFYRLRAIYAGPVKGGKRNT